MSKKVLTGQLVAVQEEDPHASAQPELCRDFACAARRSFLVRGTLVYQSSNMSKKVLTGQLVAGQVEILHGCAEAEFRRNVACAARRSFLDVGTLVYQSSNMSKKCLPVNWLLYSWRYCMAVQRPSSVGMLPVQQYGLF